jgi:diadenosine tetraphosphate (Ap4A) HIT family hydrolase
MEDAYLWGVKLVESGECDAFNIGLNSGEAAGQTVMYPHIHLIPRRWGDVEDPVGGVRNTIPGKGNYRK